MRALFALSLLLPATATFDTVVPGTTTVEQVRAVWGAPAMDYADWVAPGGMDLYAEPPSPEESMRTRKQEGPREEIRVLEYRGAGTERTVLAFRGKTLAYALLPPAAGESRWSRVQETRGAPSGHRAETPASGDLQAPLDVQLYEADGVAYAVAPDGSVRWRILFPRKKP